MPRLFTAIELPEEIRLQLLRTREWLPPGSKVTKAENLHLTLHFIGEIETSLSTTIQSELSGVAVSPFDLNLSECGSFQAAGGKWIAWAGVELSGELSVLHMEIGTILSRLQIQVDSRPYRPHITLARCKKRPFREKVEIEGSFQVSSFSLMSSQLTPGGPVYSPVERYSLA